MIERAAWIVDTNVLLSRLLAPSGVVAKAVDHALENGILLMSDATLAELSSVLYRPKFDPYLTNDDRHSFLGLLAGVSQRIRINHQVQVCRNPKDDKFLDVALAGSAHGIITGDKDLLVLDPFHDIRIMSPTIFLSTVA